MNKVLIWGAEGGIGGAVLNKFQQEGWTTVALARQLSGAGQTADETLEADFARSEDVDRVGEQLTEGGGKYQVLVYAAGDIAAGKVREADPGRWQQVLDNNLTGAFQALRVSLPLLAEGGHVFLLGAVSERLQLPGLTAYAAAKAGLEALAVALAKEERQARITVVRPGAVDTDLWDKVPFKKPSHTFSPDQVADRIWEAYQEGQTGQLDLV